MLPNLSDFAENRMDTHKNAPLTPKGREAMVRCVINGGLSKAAAARQFNTTPKTVAKWVQRFRAEGAAGLRDRSSRPHSMPGQTAPTTCAAVEALRRQRYTGHQIAAELGISPATVSRVLRRLGLNRLSALEPAELVRRYEREQNLGGAACQVDFQRFGLYGYRAKTPLSCTYLVKRRRSRPLLPGCTSGQLLISSS
jgi:transposase-like protein